jgi:alkaline phosphatase D
MFDFRLLERTIRAEGGISRRSFLAFSAAWSALPFVANRTSAADRKVTFSGNPFSLGVASGDPDPQSIVLWTRLAPKPLDPDGGMQPEAIRVRWEIADDETFSKIVRAGESVATPQLGHSVHAIAQGLLPDRWYFYRFMVGDAVSPVGRTRTLPAPDAMPNQLKLTFASCQHYEHGFYTAYKQMAADAPDLAFHLGDYIYEYPNNPERSTVRRHTGPKNRRIQTLAEYRERHALYRSDPLLQAMHATCPWFVTWDDHEFENNYANDIPEERPKGVTAPDRVHFLIQRAAAYQAYYEFMPLRPRSLPQGPDMLLYRKARFGRLAEFFVLDTRQYRTDQPNGDGLKPLNENAWNPNNTLLGATQRGWLQAGLIASRGIWNVLAQQVMMAMHEVSYGERIGFAMDQWPGAAFERTELLRFMADRKVPNPVVLTGDIHSNWVNELRVDDRQAESPIVATEFVGTSISSGGKGTDNPELAAKLKNKNPGLKFVNGERGYVRCIVTPQQWQADYVVCEDVTRADGPITLRARFVVEAGKPGVQQVST